MLRGLQFCKEQLPYVYGLLHMQQQYRTGSPELGKIIEIIEES